jgi:hypothetical protein
MIPPHITTYLTQRGQDPSHFGYATFYGRNWITISVKDTANQHKFYKLRRDPKDDETNPTKYRFYPTGSESSIFGLEKIPHYHDYVVICEGEFDCLLLQDRGINAITSTAGASAFPTDWFTHFAHIPRIYICFDSDEAGKKGTTRLLSRLMTTPHETYIISLPPTHKDVSDYFLDGHENDQFWALAVPTSVRNVTLPTFDEEAPIRDELWRLTDLLDNAPKLIGHPDLLAVYQNHIQGQIRRGQAKLRRDQGYPGHVSLDVIKAVPIFDILDRHGIPYERTYANRAKFRLRPQDKTPSAVIYVDQNSFYDYGDPELGGSVIDLVMALESCDFKSAVDKLKTFCTIT